MYMYKYIYIYIYIHFLYFGKWNFLAPRLKTFLHFLKKCVCYISGNETFSPQA